MDLSYEEVEALISQIVIGGRLETVNSRRGEILLFMKYPTREHSVISEYYCDSAKKKALALGLPTKEQMEKLIISRGLWSNEKEAEIETLVKNREAQKVVLSKTRLVPARKERLNKIISDLNSKIVELQRPKELLLDHTAERKAEEEKLLYLTWAGTYIPNGGRCWETLEDFKNEKDIVFRRDASLRYTIFSFGLPVKTIRYIARRPQWIIRYMAAQKKNGGRLFENDVYNFSIDQIQIMYWSNFYSSLHEMMPEDRPCELTVEDDDALDRFMEDYFKQQKRDTDEARMKKNSGKKTSAWSHGELIVTKSHPDFKDIEYSETPAEVARRKGIKSVDVEQDKRGRLK